MIRVILATLLTFGAGFGQAAPSYRIGGTVVDARSGAPLGRVRVMLAPTGSPQQITTFITSADGRFSFEQLPQGKYSLGAERQGYPAQGFEQHEQYATGVAVGAGLDAPHLVFRLKPGAAISGRVTDESDEPLRKASVKLFYTGKAGGVRVTRFVRNVDTDDQGDYELRDLPAGTYYVAVYAQPWYAMPGMAGGSQLDVSYPLTFFGGATDSRRATPIALKPGQHFSAPLQLRAVPSIHVQYRVQQPGAAPFPQIAILIPAFDGPDIAVDSGPGFSAGLAPGRYVVEMVVPNAPPARTEVDWEVSTDIVPEQLAAKATAAMVSGMIAFDGDFPRGLQRTLQLHEIHSGAGFDAPVDDEGKFVFPRPLPPGQYIVSLLSASDFSVWGVSATGAQANGTMIEVTRPQAISLSVAATRATGDVTGTAMRDDKPASGCMIVLVPQDVRNLALYRRDQSDSDGTFTLRSALPGNYTVIALEDWETEWSSPEVLKKYLSSGAIVHVAGNDAPSVKVQMQR